MKAICFSILCLVLIVTTYSQSRTIIKQSSINIREGKLKIVKEADGIVPIFVSVLWYNDTTMLDIVPIAKEFGSYTENNDVKVGSYYNFEFTSNEFNFMDKQIAPEHLLELVSEYGFSIKKGLLTRRIPFIIRQPDEKDAIPSYLSVTVEKVYLK